jgi:hypothetical protein
VKLDLTFSLKGFGQFFLFLATVFCKGKVSGLRVVELSRGIECFSAYFICASNFPGILKIVFSKAP